MLFMVTFEVLWCRLLLMMIAISKELCHSKSLVRMCS